MRPLSRPEVANSLKKDSIPEDPSARATRKSFRDREADKNGIVIRERTWNNRTGRHKMKPGRREADKVDAGGQGTIRIQPGVSANIRMETTRYKRDTKTHVSLAPKTPFPKTPFPFPETTQTF